MVGLRGRTATTSCSSLTGFSGPSDISVSSTVLSAAVRIRTVGWERVDVLLRAVERPDTPYACLLLAHGGLVDVDDTDTR